MTQNDTQTIYDFSVKKNSKEYLSLNQYRGKVILIVNTASQCGFTPQYQSLEKLYQKYKDRGLVILGFPCNQFGQQETGSYEEIQKFCSLNYGVSFPILDKVIVNGDQAEPLFKFLKQKAKGLLGSESIKWNFTKFLVGKNGNVIDRYAPTVDPLNLSQDIENAITAND